MSLISCYGLIGVRFIDRVNKLKALGDLVFRGSYISIHLYGPKGCDKTRLLKEFCSYV